MVLVFEVADGGQHREHRFNQHARVPCAAFADFHVGRIARSTVKPGIGQDHHLVGKLGNQRAECLIRDTVQVAVPGDKQPQMIEDKANLAPMIQRQFEMPLSPNGCELRSSRRG